MGFQLIRQYLNVIFQGFILLTFNSINYSKFVDLVK